jgi:hypothetical protein
MANPERKRTDTPSPAALSDRVERYRKEVEKVVREIGEHPQYEMKRSCSLSTLAEKLEFVKDVQSIATSQIETEKFLIIGADEKVKAFVPVTNAEEFDDARITQILDKYLSPIPVFQVFQLQSSEGHTYVLVVIPKQPRRRILAKSTIDDPKDLKPRILIREGDLWTKGTSTGKRLATVEDWDAIYGDVIAAKADEMARAMTAHSIEIAVAREKLRPYEGALLPSVFTDNDFQALMEDICSTNDESRFKVLLERLRDDTVEGWHGIGAYEDLFSELTFGDAQLSLPDAKQKVHDHIKTVFRPATRWLTLAGIYTIKNSGSVAFLDRVVDLLKEIFDTAHKLRVPRALTPAGHRSQSLEDHYSHTVPALESSISLHLIGAYIAKRNRFEYLRSVFRADVYGTSWQGQRWDKRLLAFWPLLDVWYGEPEALGRFGERLKLCAARVGTDLTYAKLFGSESAAIEALCQYEFCLELNSFLAFPKLSPDTGAYIEESQPNTNFTFRTDLIAFPLAPVSGLAAALHAEIKRAKPNLLKAILFDPALAGVMTKPGAEKVFGAFLDSLSKQQAELWMRQHHFPPDPAWPFDLEEELKRLREVKN